MLPGGWNVICREPVPPPPGSPADAEPTCPKEEYVISGGGEAGLGLNVTSATDPSNDDPSTDAEGIGYSLSAEHTFTIDAIHDRLTLNQRTAVLVVQAPGSVLPAGSADAYHPSGDGGATALARLDGFHVGADVRLFGTPYETPVLNKIRGQWWPLEAATATDAKLKEILASVSKKDQKAFDGEVKRFGIPAGLIGNVVASANPASVPGFNKLKAVLDYNPTWNGTLSATVGLASARPKGAFMAWDPGHGLVYFPDVNNSSRFDALPKLNLQLKSPFRKLEVNVGGQIGTAQANVGYDPKATNPDGTAGNRAWSHQGWGYAAWLVGKYQIHPRWGQVGGDISWMDGWGDLDPPGPAPAKVDQFDNSLFMADVGYKLNPVAIATIGVEGGLALVQNGRGEDDLVGWHTGLAADVKPLGWLNLFLRSVLSQKTGSHAYPGGFSGEAPAAVAARRYGGQLGLGGDAPEDTPPDDPTGPGSPPSERLGTTVFELNVGADIKAGKVTFTPAIGYVRSDERLQGASGQDAFVAGLGLGVEFE